MIIATNAIKLVVLVSLTRQLQWLFLRQIDAIVDSMICSKRVLNIFLNSVRRRNTVWNRIELIRPSLAVRLLANSGTLGWNSRGTQALGYVIKLYWLWVQAIDIASLLLIRDLAIILHLLCLNLINVELRKFLKHTIILLLLHFDVRLAVQNHSLFEVAVDGTANIHSRIRWSFLVRLNCITLNCVTIDFIIISFLYPLLRSNFILYFIHGESKHFKITRNIFSLIRFLRVCFIIF